MNEKECEVCSKMIKEKYKHFKTWKVLAIVFICVSVLFAVLYFASGQLFTQTVAQYDNQVDIENGGDGNTNTNNGNIVVESKNGNTGGVILLSVIIITGGVLGGCYIISQRRNNNKK